MSFGVVSGVGRGMGVLDGVVIVEGEGAVLAVIVRRPVVTNGDGGALFQNYFEGGLVKSSRILSECWYIVVAIPSVGPSVRLSGRCTVEKRLIGSRCRWGGGYRVGREMGTVY